MFVHVGIAGARNNNRTLLMMAVMLVCLLHTTRVRAEQTENQEFIETRAWARASATTGQDCPNGDGCNDRRMDTSSSWHDGGSKSRVDSGERDAPGAEGRDGILFDSDTTEDESAWCAEQRKECNGGCSVFGDMLGSVMFRCDKDEQGGTEAALCICRDENGAALRSSSRAGAVQSMGGAARSSASSMAGIPSR